LVGQHHVGERLLVHILLRRRTDPPIELKGSTVPAEGLLPLRDHPERVVAQVRTDLDALRTPLALGRIDEDAEHRTLEPLPRRDLEVLPSLGPVAPEEGALGVVGDP
jgi:hypothetical protein